MKKGLFAISFAALAAAGSVASADVVTYTDSQTGSIADNASLVLDHVVAPSDGAILSMDMICVTLSHTWAGDVSVTLTHVDSGHSVVLFDRPGVPQGTFGNSDDLGGTYCFVAASENLFPENASTGAIPAGTYQIAGDMSVFAGDDTAGTWRLTVSDGAGGDTGRVAGFSWTVTTVPTPGAAALAGLGGLAMFRRRRSN